MVLILYLLQNIIYIVIATHILFPKVSPKTILFPQLMAENSLFR